MKKFWQKSQPRSASADAIEHNGFRISPCPNKVSGGWSTEALIHKTDDPETKPHTFIRADISPDKESATTLIFNKAKTLIDQQGDKIFS